jgi:UDP-N-acetylglucosamine 4,6-dehydratase
MGFLEGKTVLVTGAGGSIGSQLCREMIDQGVKCIRAYDISEYNLHMLEQAVPREKMRLLIGDVRDRARLARAIQGCDIVIHAGALKHVKFCEYNPDEAYKTNVVGTQNIVDICREKKIKKAILISTDKAANPTSVMGTTKLLAEKIFLNAPELDESVTAFSVVRFGNVFGSAGSVVELFYNLIKENQPISISDKSACRYFMSTQQACKLILNSVEIAKGQEIFILKMSNVNILNLAKRISHHIHGHENIIWSEYGLSSGEKLKEILMTDEERARCSESGNFYILKHVSNHPHHREKLKKSNVELLPEKFMEDSDIDALILGWIKK